MIKTTLAFLSHYLALVESSSFLPAINISQDRRAVLSSISSSLSLGLLRNELPKDRYGPCDDGTITVHRDKSSFDLYFRIYHKDGGKTPLVVLHGGPSLPSQYLYPMVQHLGDERPIVFYDQLGCGKSDEPKDLKSYSIGQSVEDADQVLSALDMKRVHLLGHSYGGVLAFEYAKRQQSIGGASSSNAVSLASLILANTPTSFRLSSEESDRLLKENPLSFWKEHVCRANDDIATEALNNAFAHVGKVWAGTDVVMDYEANTDTPLLYPTLLIRGVHDFCFAPSAKWKDILSAGGGDRMDTGRTTDASSTAPFVKEVVLEQCAHYPHLEDGETFGKILDEFISDHDLSNPSCSH